jgi:hypothetical protein
MDIRITGVNNLKTKLDKATLQLRSAMAKGINDTGFGLRLALVKEIKDSFDRPTPIIVNSPRFGKASPENLSAKVYISDKDYSTGQIRSEGEDVTPSNILRPHIIGGRRISKNSEMLLRRIGVMSSDQFIVPGPAVPLDKYGNISGRDMIRILSAAGLFDERGNVMNQSARSKKRKGSMRGVYCIPRVGIFQHTASQGSGNRRWATNYGGPSVPLLLFTNSPPQYEKGRFDFYFACRNYLKKHLQRNISAAIAWAMRN